MRKNPFLANYFGVALDSSVNEEEKLKASAHFVYFPSSKHMMQRVFCPSRELEVSDESCGAVCTPLSSVSSDTRANAAKATTTGLSEGFPSSPPEWMNRLPPLSPSTSRISTPLELSRSRKTTSQSERLAAEGNSSSMSIRMSQSPPRPGIPLEKREVPGWEAMVRQSYAAIAQAKQLLDTEKEISAVNSMAIPKGINAAVAPNIERGESVEATSQKTPNATPSCEREIVLSNPIASCVSVDSDGHNHLEASALSKPPMASMSMEAAPRSPVTSVSPREEGEHIEPSPMASNAPLHSVSRHHHYDHQHQHDLHQPDTSPVKKSVVPAPLQAKCLVLTLNSNAGECAAKRMSRWPPYASTLQKNERSMREDRTVSDTIPVMVSPEKHVSLSHVENKKRKAKSKLIDENRRDSAIPISSVYGILERLADVVHPRCEEDHGNSSSKKRDADSLDKLWQKLNSPAEKRRAGGDVNRKEESMKEPVVVAPKVLMGNAPRIEGKDILPNDYHEALELTVPSSQLPYVGVNLQRALPLQQQQQQQQRRSSSRRSFVNRAPRTPSYALPTESWLCKGAELDDAPIDTSCIVEGTIKPRGVVR